VPYAAAAAWVTAVGCTQIPPRDSLFVGLAGAIVAIVVRGRAVGLTAVCVGTSLVGLSAAYHVHQIESGTIHRLAAQHSDVDVVVRLVRDPQLVSGGRLTLTDATVVAVRQGAWHSVGGPILVLSYGAGWQGLLPGQRVEVSGTLSPPRPGDHVTASLDARSPPTPIGSAPWWQRAAGRVRAALRRACRGLPADPRGLLPSLVEGDTSAVPASLQTAMRATGLTHLEAVSGENLTIVLAVVLALCRSAGMRRRSRAIAAGLAVVSFVVLARPSPSVLRAAVMSAVALLAMLSGRRMSALSALSLAVLVLVVVDPFLGSSLGFVLSVTATAGLLLVAPRWTRWLERYLPRPVAIAVAVPAAAQLACTPVLVLAFGQLTPYAVLANLLAGPAVVLATILGVVGAVAASLSAPLAVPVVWLGALPATVIAWVARGLSSLPGAATPLSRGVAVAVAICAAAVMVCAATWRVESARHEIL
jgi:competence protein ComEC